MIYSAQLMLFEKPQRLNVEEWLTYPVRRFLVEVFISFLGMISMPIPGLSAFTMPVLGVWAVQDFIDYQGWE